MVAVVTGKRLAKWNDFGLQRLLFVVGFNFVSVESFMLFARDSGAL